MPKRPKDSACAGVAPATAAPISTAARNSAPVFSAPGPGPRRCAPTASPGCPRTPNASTSVRRARSPPPRRPPGCWWSAWAVGAGATVCSIRSLALDVCAAASCPVVVVRGPAGPMSTDGPVVLGLDDVGSDVGAITAAFADADAPARRLVVVHALRGPEAMVDAMAGHPASARVAAKQEITTALAPWRSRHPGVPVEVRVVHGAPADRLLEAAAAARLLVVGTNARGPAARVVLDSTSRAVVRCSPCPVMVVLRKAHVLDLEAQDTARAPADLAAARLAHRGPTASDATPAVGRAMSAAADPWPDAVTVCTSGELADALHQAAQAWQAAPTRTKLQR